MKHFPFWLFLLVAIGPAAAQKISSLNTSYFLFNDKWESAKIEEAAFVGCRDRLSDTAFRWRYYRFSGPLITIETYRDAAATIPNGYFAFYDANGMIDSSGKVLQGRKEGQWLYYTDSLTVWQSEDYASGRLINRKDRAALQLEWEARQQMKDDGGREAKFRGSTDQWIRYLQKNMKYPERARKLEREGRVVVKFTVDMDGSIMDVVPDVSIEFSLDEEAMRLILESPRWEPAVKQGQPVKAYRRQPITFALQ